MTRLEALQQINILQDNECKVCPKMSNESVSACHGCPVYAELRGLGEQLERPRKERIEALLNKKLNITQAEIKWLRQSDVSTQKISRRIGVNYQSLRLYIAGSLPWENITKGLHSQLSDEDWEEIKDFLKVASIKEAAERFDVTENVIKYGIKIRKAPAVKVPTKREQVIKLYKQGYTSAQIKNDHGYKAATISAAIRNYEDR